jgi:hypothetical protein
MKLVRERDDASLQRRDQSIAFESVGYPSGSAGEAEPVEQP